MKRNVTIKSNRMKTNKWFFIVLAINIAVLCLAINVSMTYLHRNKIVKSEQPITDYSILEVDCGGGYRGGSTIRIEYAAKDYYVGVSRKQCKEIESATLYYDRQHDTVFEKNELSIRYIVCFFALFAFSLLLWTYPEVKRKSYMKNK